MKKSAGPTRPRHEINDRHAAGGLPELISKDPILFLTASHPYDENFSAARLLKTGSSETTVTNRPYTALQD